MKLLLLLTVITAPIVWGGIMMDPGAAGQGQLEPDVVPVSPEQMLLNQRCVGKCNAEICLVADDDDCRNFITCNRGAKMLYHATKQPCAFGTYWSGQGGKQGFTCDIPQKVKCPINYCNGSRANYPHNDGNCRTFWTCTSKGPEPKCCSPSEYYDMNMQRCVFDEFGTCHSRCPIKQDECLTPGTLTVDLNDGNCRTYWDCEDNRPHPVCCPEGQGYDAETKQCIPNGCMQECPADYARGKAICLDPNVERYPVYNGSCRTYMKCNNIDQHERWCCPSWHIFDKASQSCVERTPDMDLNCSDICPGGFSEVCPLKQGPTPDTFLQGTSGGEVVMNCPQGTHFSIDKCSCGTPITNASDNACSMELDILFDHPGWIMRGSQKNMKISENGTINIGPEMNRRKTLMFDGHLLFRLPFFQQALPNLYINLVYNPTSEVTEREVLLSNCYSLELYLRNGLIVLSLITDTTSGVAPIEASVPYNPGMWNQYRAVYNGQNVYVLNEGSAAPVFDVQILEGDISVASEGLDIGGCNIRGQGQGFKGALGQLQFSKCLKQAWIDEFNQATEALPTTP